MSIFNLLKKFKLPGFEDDFIENPAEKAVSEAPRIRGRVIFDPRDELRQQVAGEEEESAAEWGLKEMARTNDPCDIKYFPTPPFRD